MGPQRYLHTVFTAALLTTTKRWKQPRCPLAGEMDEQNVDPYNGPLRGLKKEGDSDTCYNIHNRGDMMLSETSQSQKRQILCESAYMRNLEQLNSQRHMHPGGCQGPGIGNGYQCQSCRMREICGWMVVTGEQQCECA